MIAFWLTWLALSFGYCFTCGIRFLAFGDLSDANGMLWSLVVCLISWSLAKATKVPE